ncbi:LysE family translocator [Cupriavidus plantarum]|uniref:Threonine/homoserine/homoserine lactone efflux protein n=1 Tax=Cupriavidus plantarum TaxID=942865 RepID=A0A316EZ68_9BURK|nr:LysE family translocator [Cupriavidus plantarum]NYH99526.1 threonine/homoserine/homoserine lactone efflux protein [Cupriavidus plantarum]PWK36738.1 threonine/homoserine/homoserine lactone efflux protein [Cupriavidus plantarum]CAG2151008.1 Homoserine/homoserine lactone efflux protein [Cupriavidus plantarum]SMR65826.1 Threonine/homoserine/homoserine lactone efflux protein [Cupriavidus plantarum]
MSLEHWLAFVLTSIVILIIPGPTILLVIGDALAHRGRSAFATVAGVAAGDLTAFTLSMAGLGAVLAASATLFTALKWAGAAYLVYLGVQALRSAGRAQAMEVSSQAGSGRQRFAKAWLVTALNPKSIVFFVAFVPQFLDPHLGFWQQAVVLIPTFVVMASANAMVYALLARSLASRLTTRRAQSNVQRAGGITLIGAGALIAAKS